MHDYSIKFKADKEEQQWLKLLRNLDCDFAFSYDFENSSFESAVSWAKSAYLVTGVPVYVIEDYNPSYDLERDEDEEYNPVTWVVDEQGLHPSKWD